MMVSAAGYPEVLLPPAMLFPTRHVEVSSSPGSSLGGGWPPLTWGPHYCPHREHVTEGQEAVHGRPSHARLFPQPEYNSTSREALERKSGETVL